MMKGFDMYCLMASQERFELPTDGLEGRCSIQLSYWDLIYKKYKVLNTKFVVVPISER